MGVEQRFVSRGELGVLVGPIPFPPPAGTAPVRVALPVSQNEVQDGLEPPPTSPSLTATFVTDDQGRFRVTGVDPGRYKVIATHADYADGASAEFEVKLGKDAKDLRVELTSERASMAAS